MWHAFSPRLDKILSILVYIAETLGRLGQFKRSKLLAEPRIEERNDSQSAIHLNLGDTMASMVAREAVSPGHGVSKASVSKAMATVPLRLVSLRLWLLYH